MNQRLFGKNNINISDIGLGCWQIGADWGSVDKTTAVQILKTAVDAGITFFDTADVYGNGRSEEIIGEYFNVKHESIFIATKIGRTGDLFPNNYTFNAIEQAIDSSLKRLQVDALDLVQLHCIPTEITEKGEVFDWLRQLQEKGKIKLFGASVESMDEAEMLIDTVPDLYSLQIIFNILRQKPIKTIFNKAKKNNIGIIARVPLASGLLTGKLNHESSFPNNDHRNYNKDGEYFNVGETFAGLPFHYGIEIMEELKKLVPPGITLPQMALRWILDHDAVSVVIPGASKTDQVIGNSEISELKPLDETVHRQLEEFYEKLAHKYIRGPY
ncbi:MAG: aldo/keto reductase [Bacteroidales bacterium]|nr:aldo/keto reductase [Bacteroidales bacterium]